MRVLPALEPNHQELDEKLRAAWRLVPAWLEPKRT